MRAPILILGFVTLLASCCKQPAGDDSPAASSAADDEAPPRGKLEGLTADSLSKSAKKDGFTVREESTEREEMPGATIYRLTLDHKSKGTAFIDLYDLTNVSAHASKPAAKVDKNKTLYVSAMGGPSTSETLLATLLGKSPIDGMTRPTIEGYLTSEGWKLGDSSKFKDDISGQSIVDVSANKEDADVMVVLLDYTRVASGKEQSAMLVDGARLLFVDTEKRRWSKSLLKTLVK